MNQFVFRSYLSTFINLETVAQFLGHKWKDQQRIWIESVMFNISKAWNKNP